MFADVGGVVVSSENNYGTTDIGEDVVCDFIVEFPTAESFTTLSNYTCVEYDADACATMLPTKAPTMPPTTPSPTPNIPPPTTGDDIQGGDPIDGPDIDGPGSSGNLVVVYPTMVVVLFLSFPLWMMGW